MSSNEEIESICGHKVERFVIYAGLGRVNGICNSCFHKKIYYVQEVPEDLVIYGGLWTRIQLDEGNNASE